MTEVGITHFNQDDDCRYKSVGKLMDLVEMKVRVNYYLGGNRQTRFWT